MQVNYRFYATLLDSFQYYLGRVDDDNAFQDFIDRLNRKPFYSEAAAKGTAFNDLVDLIISGKLRIEDLPKDKRGNVALYGYVDEILKYKVVDIKTTGRYVFPKYLNAWQSKIYPYCLNENGVYVNTFEYLITDFRNVYIEEYPYKPENDIVEM